MGLSVFLPAAVAPRETLSVTTTAVGASKAEVVAGPRPGCARLSVQRRRARCSRRTHGRDHRAPRIETTTHGGRDSAAETLDRSAVAPKNGLVAGRWSTLTAASARSTPRAPPQSTAPLTSTPSARRSCGAAPARASERRRCAPATAKQEQGGRPSSQAEGRERGSCCTGPRGGSYIPSLETHQSPMAQRCTRRSSARALRRPSPGSRRAG